MVNWSMQKINIIGTSGTGKSTFAVTLAKKLNYPHIELDRLYFSGDWQEASSDEFREAVFAETSARKSWVLDGDYTQHFPIKQRGVDTVIWLNYGFFVVLFRALKRAIRRVVTREKLWGTDSVETLKKLLSKQSIIWWTITTYEKKRKKYTALMTASDYQHIHFIELKSPREAQTFLENLDT